MAYPSTPTSLYINGWPEKAGKLTKNTSGSVAVSAIINDPDSRDKVRMVVRYSSDKSFKTYRTARSSFGRQGVRHRATMTQLQKNTLYYVRVYTQQRDRLVLSKRYNATSFWTARTTTSEPSPEPDPEPTPGPGPDPGPNGSSLATSRERLYLNRFGTGFTQRALGQLRQAGTPEAWLRQQLSPESIPESPKVAEIDDWFADLRRTPAERYTTDRDKTKRAFEYNRDLGSWSIMRRMYSERSVLETMVDFWSNHMHIPVGTDYAWVYRFEYDATIREHALGTFEDLLTACSLHPAMRTYLSNWRSVRNKLNENQGREILELHTVGRTSGYTEAMVKSSAVILSGYTVDWGKTFGPKYDPNAHTTGPVSVLGFSHANASADGQAVTMAYLKYLANHPATARRIAQKLATYFVSDAPSDGLVDFLAKTYTDSGTDIRAVLTALSTHPEFLTSEGRKVRTPVEDLVAQGRAMQIDVTTPTTQYSFANWANYVHGGDLVYSWPRPDGPPMTGEAYSSISRVFNSLQMHLNLGAGAFPSEGVKYRAGASWLPASTIRFDALVDHLCRTWLGRPADERLLNSATQAVGVAPSTVIDSARMGGSWTYPRLVMSIFDTPQHMTT